MLSNVGEGVECFYAWPFSLKTTRKKKKIRKKKTKQYKKRE